MAKKTKKKTKTVKLRPVAGKSQVQQLTEDDYRVIAKQVAGACEKQKCILFAGCDSGDLPVSIPVNVAIQLAEEGKKCLLIDLDLGRNAVAQVFEINNKQQNRHLMPRAIKTHVSNLLIWPAQHFVRTKLMNIAGVVGAAEKNMDVVLINVPALRTSLDRGQILAASQGCCLFSKNDSKTEGLLRQIKGAECVLISNIRIIGDSRELSNDTPLPADLPETIA